MKPENIDTMKMVRSIREKQAALYWKDKAAYIRQMKEAAKKLRELLSKQRAHSN